MLLHFALVLILRRFVLHFAAIITFCGVTYELKITKQAYKPRTTAIDVNDRIKRSFRLLSDQSWGNLMPDWRFTGDVNWWLFSRLPFFVKYYYYQAVSTSVYIDMKFVGMKQETKMSTKEPERILIKSVVFLHRQAIPLFCMHYQMEWDQHEIKLHFKSSPVSLDISQIFSYKRGYPLMVVSMDLFAD